MGGFSKTRSCFEFGEEEEKSKIVRGLRWQTTALYLPKADDSSEDSQQNLSLPSTSLTHNESLHSYLPVEGVCTPITRMPSYIKLSQLFHNKTSSYDIEQLSHKRCLNVLQGEIAHTTPLHTDIIISAEATTCVCIALRSTIPQTDDDEKAYPPLVSLAHVDKAYNNVKCLERILQEHISHHRAERNAPTESSSSNNDEDDFFFFEEGSSINDEDDGNDNEQQHESLMNQERKNIPHNESIEIDQSSFFIPTFDMNNSKHNSLTHNNHRSERKEDEEENMIDLELHIVGGYDDAEGISQEITSWIFMTFVNLAKQYRNQIKLTLSTAIILSLNTTRDDGHPVPISRGLGIDTHTGCVFGVVQSIPSDLEGPAVDVRSARLLTQHDREELEVIQNRDGEICVQPFAYYGTTKKQQLDVLLQASDEFLLQVASTSPQCESANFCSNMRRTLSFLSVQSDIFATTDESGNRRKPLVYSRSANYLNDWELADV